MILLREGGGQIKARTKIIAVLGLLALCSAGSADELLVPSQYPTIQAAIDYANEGDTVLVADGTYTGNGNRDIDFLGKAVTVQSENGPNNCIIDCNGTEAEPYRGFYFHSGEDADSIVDGFTITNGDAICGGGIYCEQSNPTVTNCTFNGNRAAVGGGMCSFRGSPTITDCIFSGNLAIFYGGGIYNSDGGPKITNCTFGGNRADDHGGGMFNFYCSVIVTNCAFSGNSATYGGGMLNLHCSATVANCTFGGNSAKRYGGAINNWSEATVTNCILYDNRAQYGNEVYSSAPGITVNYSNVKGGWPGIGNIDADPCFVGPGYWDANGTPADANDDFWVDGDYHLKSEGWRWDIKRNRWTYDDVTSRCIDAGNPGSPLGDEPLTLEVDPLNRWGENLRINMGAYGGTAEASMPPYDWAVLGDLTNDGLVNLKDCTFQAADWCNSADQQPGDLNRDSLIDTFDLALLVEDWLRQTSWHE